MSEREPFDQDRPEDGRHPHDGTLWAFVSDGLDGQEADAVAEHLAGCDACAQAIAGFGEVADTLYAVHDAPSDLARRRGRRRLEAALQQEVVVARRRGVKGPRVLLVAAVAAFAGAALATAATTDPVRSWLSGRDAAEARSVQRAALDREPPAAEPARPRPEVQAQETSPPSAPAVVPLAEPAEPGAPAATTRRASAAPAGPSVGSAPAKAPTAEFVAEAPEAQQVGASGLRVERGPRVARADGTPSPAEAHQAAVRRMDGSAQGDPRWLGVGDLAAMAGDAPGAANAYAEALKGSRAKVASERLEKLVQAGALEEAAATRLVRERGGDGAEALRVLCAWGLRHRGDRPAVAICQSFGRRFPQHPSARSLALSAGRTAEFKLKDVQLAEEEYSRAILVSQYAGVPGTSALLARARCRMKQKNLDEARADLRLFLHVQPEARWRDDVKALATQLDMSLPVPPAEER